MHATAAENYFVVKMVCNNFLYQTVMFLHTIYGISNADKLLLLLLNNIYYCCIQMVMKTWCEQ